MGKLFFPEAINDVFNLVSKVSNISRVNIQGELKDNHLTYE